MMMFHQHMTSHTFLSSHTFTAVVRFFFSFQDAGYLYMCMDLAPGGELLGLITANLNEKLNAGVENQACSYDLTKFYIAEIVEGLEYLHEKSIIHRDMKPESELGPYVLNRIGYTQPHHYRSLLIGTHTTPPQTSSSVGRDT